MFDESMPFDIFRTTEKNCDFALRESGDSMEPDIPNHSIVLIKKTDIVSEGKIGAFFLNGEVYCKRLSHQNKKCFAVQTIPNIHRLMFWKMIHSPHMGR